MAVPLIGAGVTAGRGLLAYLAKKRAMQTAYGAGRNVGKSAIMKAGYGAGKTAVNPRTAAMANLRGRAYPSDAARFVNAPRKLGYKSGIAAGGIGALAGSEMYDRVMHPREKAMNALRDSQENLEGYRNPHGNVVTRADTLEGLNVSPEGKELLREDLIRKQLQEETGGAYTDDEIQTFMGMPVKGVVGGGAAAKAIGGDTAEWNPSESIYPRFMVDQLLQQGVITIDEIFDLGAPDGDSFKIIPKGLGRLDSTRRA